MSGQATATIVARCEGNDRCVSPLEGRCGNAFNEHGQD